MRYEIRHRTTYEYEHDVLLSHHMVRLAPRELSWQRCRQYLIETSPNATTRSATADHFGNTATFLTIEGPHRRLEISSRAEVELTSPARVAPHDTPDWESVRDLFASEAGDVPIEPAEFTFASPLVPVHAQFAGYAKPSFAPGRPILAAANDLAARIHADFVFDARATTVTTSVIQFFNSRRGVCQDFAHLMIASLRSLGLPARYLSGYLETQPAPGQEKLIGADASHAWVSLWCGVCGWIDLDPTNNLLPSLHHIITAWGRDFSDVSPVRGIIVGGGHHKLNVAVDVNRKS